MTNWQRLAAILSLVVLAETSKAQPPGCYSPAWAYPAAPATAYYAAPAVTYSAPATSASYYQRVYANYYGSYSTPPTVVYGPAGVAYRTSWYTGYYPELQPPSYYTSAYPGSVVPSTSFYLPGAALYTPSNSNTPGFNRVFLTTGDFHY